MTAASRGLRVALWLEGASLLGLLAVAMPLKYAAGLPGPVRVVGAIHGLLFVIVAVLLYRSVVEGALTRRSALRLLALATLPLGFLAASRQVCRSADLEPAP